MDLTKKQWTAYFSLHALSVHTLSSVEVVFFEWMTALFFTEALLFHNLPRHTALVISLYQNVSSDITPRAARNQSEGKRMET